HHERAAERRSRHRSGSKLRSRAERTSGQSELRRGAVGHEPQAGQPMSEAVLNALERDVEQARAKFADDLARLRSPANLAQFKDDLWADAREAKDEVIDRAKEAAQDGAQRFLAELKARVAANPLATIAIGAGLAWRLVHRPPIATVLIGLGLIS